MTFSNSGDKIETQEKQKRRKGAKMNAYNAYTYSGNVSAKKNRSLVRILWLYLRAFFETAFLRLRALDLRVAATIASFVAALGMIGGMECGAVPFYIGLPVCAAIAVAGLIAHFEE